MKLFFNNGNFKIKNIPPGSVFLHFYVRVTTNEINFLYFIEKIYILLINTVFYSNIFVCNMYLNSINLNPETNNLRGPAIKICIFKFVNL